MIATVSDLRQALNEGVVLFQFVKKDGTLRAARGTTSPDLVPADDTPQGKRPQVLQDRYRQKTITFYDIDKKGWRSMQIDSLWSCTRALRLD